MNRLTASRRHALQCDRHPVWRSGAHGKLEAYPTWEARASGLRLAETDGESLNIYIDPSVATSLRNGQAITQHLDERDQTLHTFRIVLDSKNESVTSAKPPITGEIKCGWRPSPEGGLDYFVQLSPKQFEEVVAGAPVECSVHPEVKSVQHIHVFVGGAELPRQLGD
ncbi:MAG: hypothetical protein CMJ64_06900 [Planctomycetaceae bacterium]|jgi:hypothetical protein|nr:hypothetical protein [Planctomycetaceae bacterium]